MSAPTKLDVKHCAGCRDDFYNGNNPLGVTECWMRTRGTMKTRYQLHCDTPMNRRSGYQKVKVPSCYHKPRYVHVDAIPEYAR